MRHSRSLSDTHVSTQFSAEAHQLLEKRGCVLSGAVELNSFLRPGRASPIENAAVAQQPGEATRRVRAAGKSERVNLVAATKSMITRTAETFGLKPIRGVESQKVGSYSGFGPPRECDDQIALDRCDRTNDHDQASVRFALRFYRYQLAVGFGAPQETAAACPHPGD